MGTKSQTVARDQLRRWSEGFYTTMAVITAQRLGLFTRLARGPKTPEQLRRALGADRRALRRLLDALIGLGLIEWEGQCLALARRYADVLDPNSPASWIPMFEHQWHLHRSWMKLEHAVLDGPGKVLPLDAVYTDPVRNRAFNHAMRAVGREGAAEILRAHSFRGDKAVLDVGGGPGVIAAEICARRDHLLWTILDRPGALALARRRIRADDLTDRVRCLGADALTDGWPNGHDTVLMSQLIHAFGEKDCRRLISRAAQALPRGGTLLIRDFLPHSEKNPGHWAGLFGIHMLVNTREGQIHSVPALRRMLAPAFRVEKVVDAKRSQILIARRR